MAGARLHTHTSLTRAPAQAPAVHLHLQVIVERCEAGLKDPLRDALDLLVDFFAIFARLLVILMRNAEKKDRRQRDGEERDGGRQRQRATRSYRM